MKKMHSVSVRVHVLLLLMGILIAATLITSASVTNSRQVDDFLETKTSQASATIAAYVDADLVSRLTETVLTDEYQPCVRRPGRRAPKRGLRSTWRKKAFWQT